MSHPPRITIWPATLDDVDAIYALTRKRGIKEALPGVMKTWVEHDILQRIQGNHRHQVLVAEIDGILIGYIRFLHRLRPEKDGMWQTTLHEIAVDPEYQRQGVGQQLMLALQAHTNAYRKDKDSRILLKTLADGDANSFYQARGFELKSCEESVTGRAVNTYVLGLQRHHSHSLPIHSQSGDAICR